MGCVSCTRPEFNKLPWLSIRDVYLEGAPTPYYREMAHEESMECKAMPDVNYRNYDLFSLRTRIEPHIISHIPELYITFERMQLNSNLYVHAILRYKNRKITFKDEPEGGDAFGKYVPIKTIIGDKTKSDVTTDDANINAITYKWFANIVRTYSYKYTNYCVIITDRIPLQYQHLHFPQWWLRSILSTIDYNKTVLEPFNPFYEDGSVYIDLSDQTFDTPEAGGWGVEHINEKPGHKLNVVDIGQPMLYNEIWNFLHRTFVEGLFDMYQRGSVVVRPTSPSDSQLIKEWNLINPLLEEGLVDKISDSTQLQIYSPQWQDRRITTDMTAFIQRIRRNRGIANIIRRIGTNGVRRHDITKSLKDDFIYNFSGHNIIVYVDSYRDAVHVNDIIDSVIYTSSGKTLELDKYMIADHENNLNTNSVKYYFNGKPIISYKGNPGEDTVGFIIRSHGIQPDPIWSDQLDISQPI